VTIEGDSDTQVWTVNDTMDVSGGIGCSGTGQWTAQWVMTDPEGQSLDLFATGSH
jgi:hypothetical protein